MKEGERNRLQILKEKENEFNVIHIVRFLFRTS